MCSNEFFNEFERWDYLIFLALNYNVSTQFDTELIILQQKTVATLRTSSNLTTFFYRWGPFTVFVPRWNCNCIILIPFKVEHERKCLCGIPGFDFFPEKWTIQINYDFPDMYSIHRDRAFSIVWLRPLQWAVISMNGKVWYWRWIRRSYNRERGKKC